MPAMSVVKFLYMLKHSASLPATMKNTAVFALIRWLVFEP